MAGRLLDGVSQLLDARLALGSLVLVNDALRCSLVEQAAGLVGGLLRLGGILGIHCNADILDGGLQLAADGLVADTGLLVGLNALLLRLNVRHFVVPFESNSARPLHCVVEGVGIPTPDTEWSTLGV